MITIMCWYIACPGGKFDWDWPEMDCMQAQPGELGAEWKSALCPLCNHLNWVFVKCKKVSIPKKVDVAPTIAPVVPVAVPTRVPVAMLEGNRESGRFKP